MSIHRSMPVLLAALLALVAIGCAPSVVNESRDEGLREFRLEALPIERRWIVAVPDFSVGAGAVRVGGADLSQEGDSFFRELGSGVADIFLTEAFRSGQFRITERSQLDEVLREQDLALSGRVEPGTAAELGRVTGAEIIVLGSLSEFGVTTTGGGGRVLGFIGGGAETITARVTVDIRLVDADTAEVVAIGHSTSEVSQSNVRIDIAGVIRSLQAGRTGTTIVDLAVRNAIRGAIEEAAATMPAKTVE